MTLWRLCVMSRLLIALTVVLVGYASPARADCGCLDCEDSPCARFRDYPEIFIAHVVAVESVPDGSRGQYVQVTFDTIERIKGFRATRIMRFFDQPLSWHFEVGEDVIVFAKSVGGAWSADCMSTRFASDQIEKETLRGLRERRPGGPLKLYSRERPWKSARKVIVRRGSQVIARAETHDSGTMNLGWMPAGTYSIDFFDSGDRYVRTIFVAVGGCTWLRYEP